jgi:hypothetical protein
MYRIYFINFQYYAQDEYENLDQARIRVLKAGFEARIEDSRGNYVMSWSPIGGWR